LTLPETDVTLLQRRGSSTSRWSSFSAARTFRHDVGSSAGYSSDLSALAHHLRTRVVEPALVADRERWHRGQAAHVLRSRGPAAPTRRIERTFVGAKVGVAP
jgi:hypothetical protein